VTTALAAPTDTWITDTDTVPGRIVIGDGVVAKLASRAVLEVPDAGGAAPRLLGRTVLEPATWASAGPA